MKRIKIFILRLYGNQKLAPFETMFGFFCIFAGTVTILDFGIIRTPITEMFIVFIGYKLYLLLNIIYVIAGVMLYFGISFGKGNIEACGLVLLATTLLIRSIVFGVSLGFNPIIINAYILNMAIIFACTVRLRVIRNNNKILIKNGKNTKLLVL